MLSYVLLKRTVCYWVLNRYKSEDICSVTHTIRNKFLFALETSPSYWGARACHQTKTTHPQFGWSPAVSCRCLLKMSEQSEIVALKKKENNTSVWPLTFSLSAVSSDPCAQWEPRDARVSVSAGLDVFVILCKTRFSWIKFCKDNKTVFPCQLDRLLLLFHNFHLYLFYSCLA